QTDSTALSTPASPAPASGLNWQDVPNDAGRAVTLVWKAPEAEAGPVDHFVVERSPNPGGPWAPVDSTAVGGPTLVDGSAHRDVRYYYRITAVGPGGRTPALSVTGPVIATSQWINSTRWSVLVGVILYFAFVLFFIGRAQSGKKPFVRRIP